MGIFRTIVPAACALGLVGISASAAAQETAAPAPSGAPSGTAASFSDAELEKFVTAVTSVQQIAKDQATPAAEKQPKMAAAIQASGLPLERFNQIASASQTDQALMQRIQAVAAKPKG